MNPFSDNVVISELFERAIKNAETINILMNDKYYDNVLDDDVKFLENYKSLNMLEKSLKMKIYHSVITVVCVNVLKSVIGKDMVTDKVIDKICPYYRDLSSKMVYDKCNEIIVECDNEIIEKFIINALVDNIDLLSRKSSGTEMTPNEIVEFMIKSIGYEGTEVLDKRILDPSCGTGTYLRVINRIFLSNAKKNGIENVVEYIIQHENIIAFDTNPINITMSKVLLLIQIVNAGFRVDENDIISGLVGFPIYCDNFLEYDGKKVDFLVGNPPYIRLQNLSVTSREYIKNNFESATGRFDIYVCFIEKANKVLNQEGKASVITSNKYLTTNYGKGIRKYLKDSATIKLLFDLNDTKYFDAAVLPAIIVFGNGYGFEEKIEYCSVKIDASETKGEFKKTELFCYIDEVRNVGVSCNKKLLIEPKKTTMRIDLVYSFVEIPGNGEAWNFSAKNDNILKEKIEKNSLCKLEKLFEICVGIKTTADNIFVKPMTKEFIINNRFENELIFPLIQSFNIDKWKISWKENNKKDRYILYPHVDLDGKTVAADLEKYPNCKKYLNNNRDILGARTYLAESKTRYWYECWVPQRLDKFKSIKIVTRDIVSHNSFALDLEGRHCQGNTFFLLKRQDINQAIGFEIEEMHFYYAFLGILNTNILEYYQKLISGSLYSKKYRYTTTNLNRWPVPIIKDKNTIMKLSQWVQEILNDTNKKDENERLIDLEVCNLFGLNEMDYSVIVKYNNSNK